MLRPILAWGLRELPPIWADNANFLGPVVLPSARQLHLVKYCEIVVVFFFNKENQAYDIVCERSNTKEYVNSSACLTFSCTMVTCTGLWGAFAYLPPPPTPFSWNRIFCFNWFWVCSVTGTPASVCLRRFLSPTLPFISIYKMLYLQLYCFAVFQVYLFPFPFEDISQ